MTGEQRQAFAQVRALATPQGLLVKADLEGYPIIPGRLGQVEWTGGADLAVFTTRRLVTRMLLKISGVRRHQMGADESRMLFPPGALREVTSVIGAQKERLGLFAVPAVLRCRYLPQCPAPASSYFSLYSRRDPARGTSWEHSERKGGAEV